MNVPTKQRALVLYDVKQGPVLETEYPVPEPNPDEVLVNIKYSGVCHSDVDLLEGICPTVMPLIAGHEAVGVVAKLGANVTNFKIGESVGIMMTKSTCKFCEFCKQGKEFICPTRKAFAINCLGTFQEYTVIDAHHLHRLPEGIDMVGAAPLHCAGLTVYRALKETSVKPGQYVAITGAGGGLGSFAIQFSNAMGMIPIAIDIGKEEHCKNVGAKYYFDATDPEMSEKIKKVTDLGTHGVLNIAAVNKSVETAFTYLRRGGIIVNVGIPPKDPIVKVNVIQLLMNAHTLKGSVLGNRQDMDEAIAFYARGAVKVPVQLMGLSDVPKILEMLRNGKVNGRIAVDPLK